MKILDHKHHLPLRLQGLYISQDQIEAVVDGPKMSDHALDLKTLALILVGERHRKSDLVDLVHYLLDRAGHGKVSE